MNYLINPCSWNELKKNVEKKDKNHYIGLCSHSVWFSKHWEIKEDKKFLKAHARNFLKTDNYRHWKLKGWKIESGFLFWNYNSIVDFKKIRIDFCEYMEDHCTEDPYTKWEKFVINIKTWLK